MSNDLTGESAKEAIEVGKNEIGKVRRLLTENTMDLLEKMSRVAGAQELLLIDRN